MGLSLRPFELAAPVLYSEHHRSRCRGEACPAHGPDGLLGLAVVCHDELWQVRRERPRVVLSLGGPCAVFERSVIFCRDVWVDAITDVRFFSGGCMGTRLWL